MILKTLLHYNIDVGGQAQLYHCICLFRCSLGTWTHRISDARAQLGAQRAGSVSEMVRYQLGQGVHLMRWAASVDLEPEISSGLLGLGLSLHI